VAASHGVQSGPPQAMRSRDEIVSLFAAMGSADGLMVSPGLLPIVEDAYLGRGAPALVIHIDWKNTTRRVYPANSEGRGEAVVASLCNVADAAAAGAAAVMTYLHVGQQDTTLERAEIERNAHIARECDRLGLVCIIEPRSALEHRDAVYGASAEVLTFACRMAAEIGADIVKSIWPGTPEAFAEIADTCPVPVLLAGGPGGEDLEDTARLVGSAVRAGAAGVMFGRRITASPDPAGVLARLHEVLQNGGVN
jgi:fructose-bisphosphate aldolase, class I